MPKKIVIIAGPNGAGLSPFAPELAAIKAGRLMLKTIDELILDNESFAFETTLTGVGYARAIPEWRKLGYHVKLMFLQLPDVGTAVSRVAARVRQGGHDIPDAVIRRRFDAGLKNFHQLYKPLVDVWLHFDSAGDTPVLIDWSEQ